jgi:hypothetical protein
MKKSNNMGWLPWVVFIFLVILADRENAFRRERIINISLRNSSYPLPDQTKGEPLFYSLQKHDWVYGSNPRAKAPSSTIEPYEDIEKYLKKNIPIYKKKTYWGEEWDEIDKPDIIWDDEGDDHELDPEHKIK